MPGLLHVVAANLRTDTDQKALTRATQLARGLRLAEGARTVLTGRSDGRLVAATWLEGLASMEPFAASAPHMEFVMRGLAPVAASMWSAAVEIATPALDQLPAAGAGVAAIWAFALPAQDGVFEWQVRQLLDDISALPGDAAAGPTVEEREQFRAAGLVLLTAAQSAPFERELAAARTRWAAVAGVLEEALVTVSP